MHAGNLCNIVQHNIVCSDDSICKVGRTFGHDVNKYLSKQTDFYEYAFTSHNCEFIFQKYDYSVWVRISSCKFISCNYCNIYAIATLFLFFRTELGLYIALWIYFYASEHKYFMQDVPYILKLCCLVNASLFFTIVTLHCSVWLQILQL